jgi:carbamoyltransferase
MLSNNFEWNGESRWMSFCPKVKEEWREKLAAITHVDNTARVQTVTKEQNEWLYNLLTEFEKQTGVGVLLNTSFNVDGKPILSTIQDAFKILETTQMDGLVLENTYIKK